MTTGSTTWRDALVGEVQVRAIRPRNGPGCAAGDDRGMRRIGRTHPLALARNAGRLDGL
jgi:hypothetical protein